MVVGNRFKGAPPSVKDFDDGVRTSEYIWVAL